MKKFLVYIAIFVVGFLLGFIGGRVSQTEKTSVQTLETVKYVPSTTTVRDTVYLPKPYSVFMRDTVIRYLEKIAPVDTVRIVEDYYLTRAYNLDFSSDTLGTFIVDAEVSQNRLAVVRSFVNPIVKTVTVERTNTVYKVPTLQFYGMVGTSPKFNFQKVSLGVDLKQKLLLGVSGVRFDNNYNYSIDLGIKF